MGLIDNIRERFQTKEPTFNSTNKSTWSDYSSVVDSQNYLDQYYGWTYRAVKLKSDAMASYDQVLFRNDIELEKENDQLLKDLHRFNAFQTYREARKLTAMHLSLTGMAVWHISDADEVGFDSEFFILNPQNLSALKGKNGLPIAYIYRDTDGKDTEIDINDLILFRNPDPKDWFNGTGDLQASRYAHNTYTFAQVFNMNQFANNGKPEGFIIAEGISENERQRMEAMLRQKYSTPQNARKTGIVNRALSWMQITSSNLELDYVRGLEVMRKDILGIHGVPSVIIDPSESSFANMAEAQRTFQRTTIKPMLEVEMDTYNEQLIPKYYLNRPSRQRGLMFIHENPVEADKQAEAEVASLLYTRQIITREEARESLGMVEDPVGEFFRPATQQTIERLEDQLEETKSIKETVERAIEKVEETKTEFKSLPAVAENKSLKREKLKTLLRTKSLRDELTMGKKVTKMFELQLLNLLNQTKSYKTPSYKIALNTERTNVESLGVLLPVVEQLIIENEQVGNTLMRGTRFSTTRDTKQRLLGTLEEALNESNKTTTKNISEIIGASIEDGIGTLDLAKEVRDYFRKEQYGSTTINILKENNVWFDGIVIDNEGIRTSEKDMFKTMYERSNALVGNAKEESLVALHSITSITEESSANDVTNRIENDLGIDRGPEIRSRSVMIGLLLAGIVQSKVLQGLYEQNPQVEQKEWLSADDSFVRTGRWDHVKPNGQKVPVDSNFVVSGEELFEPRDLNGSLENVINCRCVSIPAIND